MRAVEVERMVRHTLKLVVLAGFAWVGNSAFAQQVLPEVQKFQGIIGLGLEDSQAAFPRQPTPPAGAPNVILVLLDDVGFGAADTFGGLVETPTLTDLAHKGLRYTRFNTTAVCSATRAALLTGRNAHRVGTATVMEGGGVGFPGYNTIWPKSAASIAEILRQHGYDTAAFGKWHNTPVWEASPLGPFDRWPTGEGFQYFYGFIGGEADQWAPELIEDTRPVERPPTQGQYHFSEDMADHAIEWLRMQRSIAPQQPFFLYFAPGGTHAPHQAPKRWIDKYKGRFDAGWDRYREEAFRRQKALGVIPADTQLTPRPQAIPPWNSLRADEKRVAARMMEVYAGFLSHTDYEVGRVLDAVKALGVDDNTLVIYIVGDNGGSAEGGLHGSVNEVKALNRYPADAAELMPHLDALGGPDTYENYPVGWAWATDTPFRWTKQIAAYFGGVRNPMVIAWPRHITDAGGIRTQFHHVVDIAPTLLEAAGIPEPVAVNGVAQIPMDGISMEYTFGADGKLAAGRRHTQYFELSGNKGIYHDGWFAANMVSVPSVLADQLAGKPTGVDPRRWELYHIDKDFSQARDLAAQRPDKLRDMENLWWAEAGRNGVLPVNRFKIQRSTGQAAAQNPAAVSPASQAGKNSFVYYPGAIRIPYELAPPLQGRSYRIDAELTIPAGGAEGIIVTEGGKFGGYALYIRGNRLFYAYNWFNTEHFAIESDRDVPSGRVSLRYEFSRVGNERGAGGIGRLYINGSVVGQADIRKTMPRSYLNETFDVGRDSGTPVDGDYRIPFTFSGELEKVTFTLN